jgi:hypothetical protein
MFHTPYMRQERMPAKENITLDIVLERQSVSAAGTIWQKRRVVVSNRDISFGRPGQHRRLDYMWLHDIKNVQIHDSLSSAIQASTTGSTSSLLSGEQASAMLLQSGARGERFAGTPIPDLRAEPTATGAEASTARASEASAPIPAAAPTEYRGFLHKRGQINTSFQKRYFVLQQVGQISLQRFARSRLCQ